MTAATAGPATRRRLHEIASDFLALEELLIEAGGEWSDAAEALTAELQGDLGSVLTPSRRAMVAQVQREQEKYHQLHMRHIELQRLHAETLAVLRDYQDALRMRREGAA